MRGLHGLAALVGVALCASVTDASVHSLDGNLRFQEGNGLPYPVTATPPPKGAALAKPGATAMQTTGPGPKKLLLSPGALIAPAEDFTLGLGHVAASKWFQLHTAISIAFPETMTASGGPAGPAAFSAGGRTGGATETWCPGSGATPPFACTDPAQGGAIHGLLRYTATKSQFGGPARASVGGVLDYAVRAFSPPPCSYAGGASPGCIASMASGLPAAPAIVGAGFGSVFTHPGTPPSPGRIYVTATGNGRIVATAGPTPLMAAGLPYPVTGYGGPWTTGMLTVSVTNNVGPGDHVFVLSGSDHRNPAGRGRLSLVAGGVSTASLIGPTGDRGWLNLEIGPPPGAHVPALPAAAAAALFALAAGSGGVALRRRSRR